MHFIHTENFLLSTKSNLMHVAPWSEDDLRQLSNCGQKKRYIIITVFIIINNAAAAYERKKETIKIMREKE